MSDAESYPPDDPTLDEETDEEGEEGEEDEEQEPEEGDHDEVALADVLPILKQMCDHMEELVTAVQALKPADPQPQPKPKPKPKPKAKKASKW